MAITKRYVELMNGQITVTSKKGAGSTFAVELPLQRADKDDAMEREQTISPLNLHNVHILLAEDNDLNAEIATVQLEELGIQITSVSNGKEALRLFADNPVHTFDLILMDIMMPEMDGYTATKSIRTLSDRPDGKCIHGRHSGIHPGRHERPHSKTDYYEAGGKSHCQKYQAVINQTIPERTANIRA